VNDIRNRVQKASLILLRLAFRVLFGLLAMLLAMLPLFITIILEDIGRGDDQRWWDKISTITLLGTTDPRGAGVLGPIILWFVAGFWFCIWLERLLAKAYRRLTAPKPAPPPTLL
jgi:hypothetical protein